MSNQSGNIESTASIDHLFDSCEGMVFKIPPALMHQLAENATFLASKMTYGQTAPVVVTLQASNDKSKTIKPTMTVAHGKDGFFGVIILEIEDHTSTS